MALIDDRDININTGRGHGRRWMGGVKPFVYLLILAFAVWAGAGCLSRIDTVAQERAQWEFLEAQRQSAQTQPARDLGASVLALWPIWVIAGVAWAGRWFFQHGARMHYGVQETKAIYQPGQTPQSLTYSPHQTVAPAQLAAPPPLHGYDANTPVLGGGVLPPDEWLRRLNHEPDIAPHWGVTGPTGSGKTTFVLAALTERPGRFVVCTTKGEEEDGWGGLPTVRPIFTEDDQGEAKILFAPMRQAVERVFGEMHRRYSQKIVDPEWLTLIIDDYSNLAKAYPRIADEMVPNIAGFGRAKRIRLIICDTELNVKAWGLDGRSESRRNFIFTEHERRTRAVKMGERDQRGGWIGEPVMLDVSPVLNLSRGLNLAGRAWSQGERQTLDIPRQTEAPPPPSVVSDTDDDTHLARLIEQYGSRDAARRAGHAIDNNEWTRVRQTFGSRRYRRYRH